ncbi:nose resistant to fluoxetine protein 6 [Nephila pilipes]|uniref:Nose resistant to fluoxetine protein 6 n=1 Tax=Nephila pilipes TaxID=299642 RepID=A0A8X6MUI4_NEPPI|nr:nose resistant to fluoxetine protein 6 [Nephila pilipes]
MFSPRCLLLLLLCVGWSLTQGEEHAEEEEQPVHVRQAWTQVDQRLRSATNKIIRKALPALMKEIYKKDISTTCLTTLLHTSNALKQSKAWAFKMLDSSGRLPEGMMYGTLTSLGNYQECVEIRVNDTKLTMKGQYCTVVLRPPLPAWKPFTSMHITMPEVFNISAPDSIFGTSWIFPAATKMRVTKSLTDSTEVINYNDDPSGRSSRQDRLGDLAGQRTGPPRPIH